MKTGKTPSQDKKKLLGQYFTEEVSLQNTVFEFIKNSPSRILEPCIGRGHLVSYILEKRPDVTFDKYEIDSTLDLIKPSIKDNVQYCDFLQLDISEKYETIVGNPPFVRTKKGNLYIDFISKCYNLLTSGGELIFIVPSDFFKLTSSVKVIEEMMNHGTFTHIHHPNKENLFESASIDVLIFRYCKDADLTRDTIYNGKIMKLVHNNGLITFSSNCSKNSITFSDVFNIYVGLVSAKEEVFKNSELANIEVLNGEIVKEKYIFVDKFPTDNDSLNNYLLDNKQILLDRKIKKFTENNWFQWGAPRNMKIMEQFKDKYCIYVYNLTRQSNVAFLGKVQYFGGGLLMMIPKNELSVKQLQKHIDHLNSKEFKQSFTFSGRFKIGHRQLCESFVNS